MKQSRSESLAGWIESQEAKIRDLENDLLDAQSDLTILNHEKRKADDLETSKVDLKRK